MMQHAFDGSLELTRPLADLETVFDMTGLALRVSRGAIVSAEPGLVIASHRASPQVYSIEGSVDDERHDPEDVLGRLAMAFDADGIRFTLRLRDARGDLRVSYESDH